jgi:hypothetical protein
MGQLAGTLVLEQQAIPSTIDSPAVNPSKAVTPAVLRHRFVRLASGNEEKIREGRTSYPSGHAAETTLTFGLLTFYLLAQLRLFTRQSQVGVCEGGLRQGCRNCQMSDVGSSWPRPTSTPPHFKRAGSCWGGLCEVLGRASVG